MPESRLRRVLLVNAGFSATTGFALLLGSGSTAVWLGTPGSFSVALGTGLLAFAVAVSAAARRLRRSWVGAVLAADTAWVVGALLVLIVFPTVLSVAGRWSLAVVTSLVAALAVLQWMWLRRVWA